MRQKSKLGLLLIILVALPLFALGIIGLHALKSDLNSYELKVKDFADQQLIRITTDLSNLIENLKITLHKDVESFNERGEWFMRCSTHLNCTDVREKGVDTIITFNADGEQIYPPAQSGSQLYLEGLALKKISSSLNSALDRLKSLPLEQKQQGVWTNFASPKDQKLLHCWLARQNIIMCTVINANWLINKLIDQVKSSIGAKKNLQLRLLGSNRNPIWQSANVKDAQFASLRPLNAPLHFWRLEIWQPAAIQGYNYPLILIALILPLTALLVTIAYALFREQKQALSEAENRANFAASVSHELRTPLTNLQLYAELINEKSKTLRADKTKDISKYAQIISSETTRLSELVDNAITIAKGSGYAHGGRNKAIPDHIIRETVSRLKPLLKNQMDKISYRLNTDYEVQIDRRSLEQILVNLLDNARKYAPDEHIRISSYIENDTFTLIVRDWGPSFKKGQSATLFTPFNGHDQEDHTQTIDGFGLGLAVCQQLAEANQGSITAERANPGARFIVTMCIEQVKSKDKAADDNVDLDREAETNNASEDHSINETSDEDENKILLH